jgi:hypothetical protein
MTTDAEDCALLNELCRLVRTLYGHTRGRAGYRVRVRKDLFRRIDAFRRSNCRILDVDWPKSYILVEDKAVVTSR